MTRPNRRTYSAFIFMDLSGAFNPSLSLVLCPHYGPFTCSFLSEWICSWSQLHALLMTICPLKSQSVSFAAPWTFSVWSSHLFMAKTEPIPSPTKTLLFLCSVSYPCTQTTSPPHPQYKIGLQDLLNFLPPYL